MFFSRANFNYPADSKKSQIFCVSWSRCFTGKRRARGSELQCGAVCCSVLHLQLKDVLALIHLHSHLWSCPLSVSLSLFTNATFEHVCASKFAQISKAWIQRTATESHTHTHTQTLSLSRTHTHIHTHTHTHTHIHTIHPIHTRKHTHAHARLHTQRHKHKHTRTQTHTNKLTNTNMQRHTIACNKKRHTYTHHSTNKK